MPLAQLILLKVPSVLLCIIMVGSFVALSAAGLLLVRRYVPHNKLKLHNDVAGPIFSTLGVVYAVLLAFVVIIVWENFNKCDANSRKEANRVVDLYRDSEAFSPGFRAEVRGLLKDYMRTVVSDEWKSMAKGQPSAKMDKILNNIWRVYSNYSISTPTQDAFFRESVGRLNELGELRMMRIIDSRMGLQPILWFVLIAGGMITVSFTFFFGSENFAAQTTMAIMLAVIISLILFTIFSMDYPFTGDVNISADPFVQALTKMGST